MSSTSLPLHSSPARAQETGPDTDELRCYHCAEPVPAGTELLAAIDGVPRPMCCAGCQAVAEAIVAAGLGDYYRLRTEPAATGEGVVPEFLREVRVYDHADVQRSFVRDAREGAREASLILEGIECAACAWLNERHLRALPGVLDAEVNYATHRARVLWDPARTRLSEVLAAVKRIGYAAHPYDPERLEALLDAERRASLRRLGVAGALGMQVMMIAIALYAGDWYGMESGFRRLFLWASLALTAPVVVYCAGPFFRGALRDLRNRRPGMDVPVALGIAIAFAGSVHATVIGEGHVYFDSVVMFVFLLSLARHLELLARRRGAQLCESLVHPAPAFATRLGPDGAAATVPAAELRAGDRVLVRPGATVPADGEVLEGRSTVDEALLTGESNPVAKRVSDAVLAGAINFESPLVVAVRRTGADTVLARILDLVERARGAKPRMALLADRVAGYFVSSVLVLACAVALYWWHVAPEQWLAVTVAVLVVTCPCALSLATPTAITAAIGALTERGLVPTRADALERLARATCFVFDKTGTLTHGRPRVVETVVASDMDRDACERIAAGLEQASEHPVGMALAGLHARPAAATGIENTPGEGLTGTIDGKRYLIGTPAFVARRAGHADGSAADDARSVVLLADAQAIRCRFHLADELRPGAERLVRRLRAQGKRVALYSGDREDVTRRLGQTVGIDEVAGELTPERKLARVRELQARGERVAMVGDGINDAPVLAAADVSVAMGHGAQAARASADLILLGDRLEDLASTVAVARKSGGIIRQNLAWAVTYNLIALPAAMAGLVAPWMAAIGMSTSSLVVVGNSLRAGRRADSEA